jgi:hypothetical protein
MKKVNQGYKREKTIVKRLGLSPIPFSGSRWWLGNEDGSGEHLLAQVKSTGGASLAAKFTALYQLRQHCNPMQIPVFVLDFIHPSVGDLDLPDEQWVAMPIDTFQEMWKIFCQYKGWQEDQKV